MYIVSGVRANHSGFMRPAAVSGNHYPDAYEWSTIRSLTGVARKLSFRAASRDIASQYKIVTPSGTPYKHGQLRQPDHSMLIVLRSSVTASLGLPECTRYGKLRWVAFVNFHLCSHC